MRRPILIGCLLVWLSLTAQAQWNTANLLRSGQNAIYYDDYVSAIENFNQIIRIKPHLSEPFFFRGVAKLNLDDFDGAIRDFTEAVDRNPNYYQAYLYRGVAFNALRRYEDALANYELAVAIHPGDALLFANRAMTKGEIGDFKGAENDYSKALIIYKDYLPAYLNRAIMREKLGNKEGAMADCNVAIQLNLFSEDAYFLRGYLLYSDHKYTEAIDDFNKAEKINPKNSNVIMSRALAWYSLKRYNDALADYTTVAEMDEGNAYAFYNRALLRSELGNTKEAISDLDVVLKLNPDNILVYFNRGLMKMELEDLEGAMKDFDESIRRYPDFARAYQARASIYARKGDIASAQKDDIQAGEIIERYRRMKEGDHNALVDTTENFRRLVDLNNRSDQLRDVVRGRVQDKNVIVEMERIFVVEYIDLDTLRKGKVQYFNSHIMDFNLRYNYNPAITITNRDFRYSDEFLTEKISLMSERLSKNRKDTDALLLRGSFLLCKGDYTDAIRDFKEILSYDASNLFATFNLANARMKMFDFVESIDEKGARVIGEDQRQVNRTIDYSSVVEGYEATLAIDPTFVYAHFNMADVLTKKGEFKAAVDRYTLIISLDQYLAEAYFNRGLLYIYLGEIDKANTDLGKAGELGLTASYNIIKRYCSPTSK